MLFICSRFSYPSQHAYSSEIVTAANKPIGVAVDSFYNHIYWTEKYTGRLKRCNLDGSDKSIILETDPLFSLLLDSRNGFVSIYFTITQKGITRHVVNDHCGKFTNSGHT